MRIDAVATDMKVVSQNLPLLTEEKALDSSEYRNTLSLGWELKLGHQEHIVSLPRTICCLLNMDCETKMKEASMLCRETVLRGIEVSTIINITEEQG
jgi:hypothetical protein